jgi:hypothetical protein
MTFFLCDIFRKLFRTSNSPPGFSLIIISDQSTLSVKSRKISYTYLICFLLILLISLGGLTRGLVIVFSCLMQSTFVKIEYNKNQKLVAGSRLLDNYLSDFLRNDQTKCEMPEISVPTYNQVSRASLFMIDKSVIVDFKNLIIQIDRFSGPFISSPKNKEPLPGEQISLLCPAFGTVTSFFGIRTDPVFEGTEKHCGVDIAAPLWSPVVSAAEGIVSYAGWNNRYGNLVIINHGKSGIQTVYAHLQKVIVRNNNHIMSGQRIGYIGSTGKSTGPHLHYEVRKNGTPVNPISYLLPQNEVAD